MASLLEDVVKRLVTQDAGKCYGRLGRVFLCPFPPAGAGAPLQRSSRTLT